MHPIQNPQIEKAIEKLKCLSQDPAQRALYQAREKELRDHLSRLIESHREGWEKGREEGIQEGVAKGREEGIQEEKRRSALKLRAQGLSAELIASVLDVSIEWVHQLKDHE